MKRLIKLLRHSYPYEKYWRWHIFTWEDVREAILRVLEEVKE